ncbi:MAG: hypothetical protein QOK07_3078 [Gemmatimonadaceae bacterium]|jgi:hypothetical protein|nr:hypothetical protein [Gemmatimonadaceae bacterium]
MRPIPALSLAVLALACSGDPSAPPTANLHPSLAAATSASEPNVIRFRDQFAVGVFDPEADLVAFAGLPSNPDDLRDCGGVESFQSADYQFVGVLQRAVKALVVNGNTNLHVFRYSTFVGCGSVPIAQGTGRVMYTDSDIFYSGGKNDAWGFRMEGTVTFANGSGTAHLVAHNRFQIKPDGSFRQIFRDVKLSGQ